jgi:predicted metal-dependent hydrolase
VGVGLRLPTENLDGFRFLLLGEEHTVSLYDGARIVYRAEEKRIFVPRKNARERLVKWLKENARRILTDLTQAYSVKLSASYRSIAITTAKSRWGSCSGDNALRYTFRLIYAPREVMEYVVVHELCHVFEKNHSSAFWTLVARTIPDWKARRKWLKDQRFVMEIF